MKMQPELRRKAFRALSASLLKKDYKVCGRMHRIVGGNYKTAVRVGPYMMEFSQYQDDYMFYIWTPTNIPCVSVAVMQADHEAHIQLVTYDAKCTIDGKMPKGTGTRQMLEFTFQMLKKKGVRKVTLSDESHFKCNGKEVDLKIFSFIKYGMTWYEKHFGFMLEDPDELAKYITAKAKLESYPDLEHLRTISCEEYTPANVRGLKKALDLTFLDGSQWMKLL